MKSNNRISENEYHNAPKVVDMCTVSESEFDTLESGGVIEKHTVDGREGLVYNDHLTVTDGKRKILCVHKKTYHEMDHLYCYKIRKS